MFGPVGPTPLAGFADSIFLHWMTMAADNDGAVVVTGACPPISRRSDRAGQSIYSVGFCRLPG